MLLKWTIVLTHSIQTDRQTPLKGNVTMGFPLSGFVILSDLFLKLAGFKLLKNFPVFYGKRSFFTALIRVRHLFLSSARTIHYMPPFNFLKIHFNIILKSTPKSSKCSVFLKFPYQNFMHLSSPPFLLHAQHILLFDLITRIIFCEQYKS